MIVIVPCMVPCSVGVNVAVTVQVAFGGTIAPQLDFTANGALAVIDWIFKSVLPVLVSLTACGELVVPTA